MKAYELMQQDEVHLCRGHYAEGPGGVMHATSPDANGFCVLGALQRCYHNAAEYTRAINQVADVLRDKFDIQNVWLWNDAEGRTKEEVIAVLKEANV